MDCKDRLGNIIKQNNSQDKLLRNLYNTNFGEKSLKILTHKYFSKTAGFILNSKFSKIAIDKFIKENNININEYEGYPYKSYNDFFIRKIKKEYRPFDMNKDHFISPCDSKLLVHEISENNTYTIKDVNYTFYELTKSKKIANKFKGGYLMIFRLSVDDYHRYYYVDDGKKTRNVKIDGLYHTVNPIATNTLPIYKENKREMCILKSENFDDLMLMEIGAMVVGKIVNYHQDTPVKRGQEKGRFEFGGSTVIIAVKKDILKIDEDILENTKNGFETKVKLGEKIAVKY